jgi:hypothetical protein
MFWPFMDTENVLCATVNRTSQPACLTGEVEFEVEVEDVGKRFPGDLPHSTLSDRCKDSIQEFTKEGRPRPCGSICVYGLEGKVVHGGDERTAEDKRTCDNPNGLVSGKFEVESVNDVLEDQWYLYVQDLRVLSASCTRNDRTNGKAYLASDEKPKSNQYAALGAPIMLRPDVRHELLDDSPVPSTLLHRSRVLVRS